MKSPWKFFSLVFIIFNLLSLLLTGVIYGVITGEHLSVVVRILFFLITRFAGGEKRKCAYDAKRNNITMCGDTLDDDKNKKTKRKKKIRSLDCYSIYGCLPFLPIFIPFTVTRSLSFSVPYFLDFALFLLLLLNYSWLVYSVHARWQSPSALTTWATRRRKNEISINPSFKLPHYNNFIFLHRFFFLHFVLPLLLFLIDFGLDVKIENNI